MLKAPFPWFGGKSKVAPEVWAALGDVEHYVEPFAGSLAVLLGRPTEPRVEIVNDKDAYIVNFWRALQHDPEQVAHHANNPVNESDLTARHIWLVNQGAERIARIDGDPDYYDAKVAGWWVWGLCCWIGSGWCAGTGPWGSVDGKLVNLREEGRGQGVNRQRVHLGRGQGVNRKRPQFGGQSGKLSGLLRVGDGAPRGTETGEAELFTYLHTLAERLRYVRVCCGDWARVVTNGALSHGREVGIFLDPPYTAGADRDAGLYVHDSLDIGHEVAAWAFENGSNPRYRIVLAGYEGEYSIPPDWTTIKWQAGASYMRANNNGKNQDNRKKERLWLSPYCLCDTVKATTLRMEL